MHAYAAVVYTRARNAKGQVKITIARAKTRVAPLKTLTIPRLELCGAVLLAKLISRMQLSARHAISNTYCYSDSQIVLAWLAKPPNSWVTYVANRVSAVQTLLPKAEWSHVRSQENPADLNSRGIRAAELEGAELWWQGPSFLKKQNNAGYGGQTL